LKTYRDNRAILEIPPIAFSGCEFTLAGSIRDNQVDISIYPDWETCFHMQNLSREEFERLLKSWQAVGAKIKTSMVIDFDKKK